MSPSSCDKQSDGLFVFNPKRNRMRPIHFLTALMLSVCLSSCIGTAVKTVVKKTGLKYSVPSPILYSENGDFKGLGDFIETSGERANILLTHGLTDKSENHFDLLVERLAAQLKLKMIKNRGTAIVVGDATNDPEHRMLGFDSWKLFQWKFVTESNKPVNFYFVYWAPVTRPAKDFIHAYNESIHRTRLSSLSKDSLFINIFGDLALYLNPDYKLQLQRTFLACIEHIEGPFTVVGGGFGVQLLFEAVLEELYSRNAGRIAIKTAQVNNRGIDVEKQRVLEKAQGKDKVLYTHQYDIPRVYLLTNQIPFVSLLTLKAYDRLTQAARNEDVLAVIRNFCAEKSTPIDLISFYDPNDPFGYVLPGMMNDPWIRLYNVRLNIGETWRIDPIKTTEFVLPQIKSQKAQDVLLSVIDQKATTQDLMLNLKSPSNLTRFDYRVMGALAEGSDYKFVCHLPAQKDPRARTIETRRAESLLLLKASIAEDIAKKLKIKLELKSSVLPFSLPSLFREVYPDTIRSLTFQGIDRSIATNEITQILTVHGVKNQEPDSFDDIVNSCAKSLGFYSRPASIRFVCPDNETCPSHGQLELAYRPGTVKITTFEGVSGQRLIIYSAYWSSVTKPAKEWLDSVSIQDESSVIPKLLKRELINDGFADIEISFGEMRLQVNSVFAKAFKEMNEDYKAVRSKRGLNTYYLTGSLGSRLLLDYLGDNISNPTLANSDVLAVQSRARTWFMLTNQLIMTALKDIPLNDPTTSDLDDAISYEQVFKTSYQKMLNVVEDSSPFDIVGFNDPNDLLSFILPDSVMGVGTQNQKVYNTYLNLAKGVNVNMDNLIRTVAKADKKLKKKHRREYRKQLHCFRTCKRKVCNSIEISKSDNEYSDYYDMLRDAKNRFTLRTRRIQRFAPPATKINPEIEQCLMDGDFDSKRLRHLFNRKKRWYSSNLYLSKDQWEAQKASYRDLKKELNKGRKPFQGSKVIAKRNFKRLFRPGLIMPFIRSIADSKHYQDFVTDFDRAHVGAKENSKIVQMISHGFESVTKTNVDQHLYEKIHNARQNRDPGKR